MDTGDDRAGCWGHGLPPNLRLLLVDAQELAARTLECDLARHAPAWGLDWVTTAEQCLKRALTHEYGIILVDQNLRLPISGFDACRELRRYGCATPVLVYSADDSIESRQRAHDVGADSFLSKCLDRREIVARIAEVFLHPPQRAVRECGNLRLDLRTMSVWTDNELVAVSRAEYCVLLELTRRIGEAVPFSRLCQVSGTQAGQNFNNLHGLMHRLRRRLGKAANLIETDEGRYRFRRPPWFGFSNE